MPNLLALTGGLDLTYDALAMSSPGPEADAEEQYPHAAWCPLYLEDGHYQPPVGLDADGRPTVVEPECKCGAELERQWAEEARKNA